MEYLQTIVFILIIAALVQLIEIILKRYMPPLYNALGIHLPLITTNRAVLGVTMLVIDKTHGIAGLLWFYTGAGQRIWFGHRVPGSHGDFCWGKGTAGNGGCAKMPARTANHTDCGVPGCCVLPWVPGSGRRMWVKEEEKMNEILIPILLVAGIGLVVGLGLAIASIVMAVPKDEKGGENLSGAAGGNCGACGFFWMLRLCCCPGKGRGKTGLMCPGRGGCSCGSFPKFWELKGLRLNGRLPLFTAWAAMTIPVTRWSIRAFTVALRLRCWRAA